MGTFAEFNEAYAAAFGDHRPARSTVEVSALPGGMAVEVEAWAYKPRVTLADGRPRCGWGEGEPAVRRLPRHRVGRARARPAPAVRVRDPRGRPGRAVVVDDPAQARRLPRRCFAGFDPARSPRSTTTTSPAASPTRASSATGPRSARPSATPGPGSSSTTRSPSCGRSSTARRCRTTGPALGEVPATTRGVGRDEQGAQAARLPVRRADDLLRADAGVRPRQRPRHDAASATPSAPQLALSRPWPVRSSSSSCCCSSPCWC